VKNLDSLTTKISTTLKSLRGQRSWSLRTTSQKTGVSKAMLGQIERGESSPTISTLWKIASGFDVSFSSFVEDVHSNQTDPIHRKQDLKQMHAEDNKIKIMSLFAYDKQLAFEVFIIELLPGCEHLSPPHQKGVIEHVIVLSGEIEVLINGNWHIVKQYEGLRFAADKPHGYRNATITKTVFQDLVHYNGMIEGIVGDVL
jgi:transcriptional regulator with XRE-family HTH domain